MIRAFSVASAVITFLASVLAACGGTVCQPDRCGAGNVCGLAGTCEPAPTSGSESEEEALIVVDEDAPLERAYEVSCQAWGTSEGAHHDEVALGGEAGETLYLAFSLDALGGADIGSAVLELQPSEDTTYGAVQTVEVWDVTPFDAIDLRRLPGARFERHARRTVWQEHLRFDVSEMAHAAEGTLYLAIHARGEAPGWRLATPSALDPLRRPRLIVHSAAEPSEEPASGDEAQGGVEAGQHEADDAVDSMEQSLPR